MPFGESILIAPERRHPSVTEPAPVRWLLVSAAAVLLGLFVLVPLAAVFATALRAGLGRYVEAILHPDTRSAIGLTLLTAAIVVPLNALFGIAAAWAIANFRFRGKRLLITLIDLPFSVSPVIAGLALVLVFGRQGWLGSWLDARQVRIVFAVPGVVLATAFVTVPYVAREVLAVLEAQGSDEEAAALTLGASGWQILARVTLPKIRWGLLYGIALCNARRWASSGRCRSSPDTFAARPSRCRCTPRSSTTSTMRWAHSPLPRCSPCWRCSPWSPRSTLSGGRAPHEHRPAGGHEALHRGRHAGGLRRVVRRAARRDHRAARAFGRREVDGAAHRRGPGGARLGPGAHRRRGLRAGAGAEARRRVGVPALRPLPPHDRPRERRLRALGAARPSQGDRRARRRAAAAGAAGAPRRPLSRPALRRTAAADRVRPCPGGASAGAAPRRTVRGAGRGRPPRAAGVARAAPRRP